MHAVTTIGLDIAKSVFQVHGIAADGSVVVRRQLKRRQVLPFFAKLPPCLIGMEACASSHQCARAFRMRVFDRDLIRGGHYGQRSCEPHQQAEHRAAPTSKAT